MMKSMANAGSMLVGGAISVTLIGCGGSSPEAESPSAEPEPTMAAEATPPDEPEPMAEEGGYEREGASDSEGGSMASSEDFKAALQVVIQDSALQRELKLEEPGRFPLKISGSDIPSSIELVAVTEAVQVVPAPENAKEEPVLVFTDIDIKANEGTFKYRYDVEGVRGTSYVVKGPSGWELKSSRVSAY